MKDELRDLFQSLKRDPEYEELRKWQQEFTEIWHKEKIDSFDLIGIRVPTGTGKTLIGLLILEYFRRKGLSCLYASGDYALLRKVEEHAEKMGIKAEVLKGRWRGDDHERRTLHLRYYHRKEIIGLTVYANLLYSVDIEKPDILLIDDADIFLDALHDKFSIRIPKEQYSEVWKEIYSLLNEEIYGSVDGLELVSQEDKIAEILYFTEAYKAHSILDEFFLKEFGQVRKASDIKDETKKRTPCIS